MPHISNLLPGHPANRAQASNGTSLLRLNKSDGTGSNDSHESEAERAEILAFLTTPEETPTSRGVYLSRIAGEAPVGEEDFDHLLSTLTAAYGTSYHDENSVEYMRAEMVYQQAAEDRWSGPDFRKRIKAFIKANKWPTWTPADFFAGDRPKVWNHTWYVEQITAPNGNRGNIPMLAAYRVPGTEKPVWGWRHEVGDALPEHVPVVVPEARQLEGPAIQEAVQKERELVVEVMKLQVAFGELQESEAALRAMVVKRDGRIVELQEELLILTAERNRERDRADALERELAEYEYDDELTSGYPVPGMEEEFFDPDGVDDRETFPVTGLDHRAAPEPGRDAA